MSIVRPTHGRTEHTSTQNQPVVTSQGKNPFRETARAQAVDYDCLHMNTLSLEVQVHAAVRAMVHSHETGAEYHSAADSPSSGPSHPSKAATLPLGWEPIPVRDPDWIEYRTPTRLWRVAQLDFSKEWRSPPPSIYDHPSKAATRPVSVQMKWQLHAKRQWVDWEYSEIRYQLDYDELCPPETFQLVVGLEHTWACERARLKNEFEGHVRDARERMVLLEMAEEMEELKVEAEKLADKVKAAEAAEAAVAELRKAEFERRLAHSRSLRIYWRLKLVLAPPARAVVQAARFVERIINNGDDSDAAKSAGGPPVPEDREAPLTDKFRQKLALKELDAADELRCEALGMLKELKDGIPREMLQGREQRWRLPDEIPFTRDLGYYDGDSDDSGEEDYHDEDDDSDESSESDSSSDNSGESSDSNEEI